MTFSSTREYLIEDWPVAVRHLTMHLSTHGPPLGFIPGGQEAAGVKMDVIKEGVTFPRPLAGTENRTSRA
jgi:hypothetical protein